MFQIMFQKNEFKMKRRRPPQAASFYLSPSSFPIKNHKKSIKNLENS